MQTRAFKQVDVFTDQAYFGNPLAVVLDASDLDEAAMARFAQWTNLSETTFLLPPTDASADYRVRIFTPGGELPFAGHPTLGSCHSWLQAGGQPRRKDFIVQECKQGLVKIRREASPGGAQRLAFAAPVLKRSAPDSATLARVAGALGIKASQIVASQLLDNGPVWLGLLLDSADTVLQLSPDHQALDQLKANVGIAGRYAASENASLISRANREARAFSAEGQLRTSFAPNIEVRVFVPSIGVNEDPMTGAFNAALAQWLIADGHLPERYAASQGICLGRAGQVHLERDASGQVWVGGETVTCIDGSVTL